MSAINQITLAATSAGLATKGLMHPLTDERRTTICAPSLALSLGECQRRSSTKLT